MRSLTGPTPAAEAPARLLETGIKVIDVMCPLVAGGTVALAGDLGAGMTVVMEELVRRLSGGSDPLSIFVMMPPPSPEWPYSVEPGFSHAEALSKEGYSEGTVGAVQTFFFRADDGPWTAERLAALAPLDTVIRLSHERGQAKVYPTVDALASRSRLLEAKAKIVSMTHRRTGARLSRRCGDTLEPAPASINCCCNARLGCRTISPSRSSAPSLTATVQGRRLALSKQCAPARKSSTADMTTCR